MKEGREKREGEEKEEERAGEGRGDEEPIQAPPQFGCLATPLGEELAIFWNPSICLRKA